MRNSSLALKHPGATRAQLVAFAKEVPGAWVGLKIAALLLVVEGQRPGWIAEVLGLNRGNLARWVEAINARGLRSLVSKPRPGRPSRLTPKIQRTLATHLERSPQAFGLPRAQWDGPTLVEHLRRQFGIHLKVRQAQGWLHQLGYRLKRAGYSYLQARTGDAQRFQRALKKTARLGPARDRRVSR